MRIWGKVFQNNHLIADHVGEVTDPMGEIGRTKKVFACLEQICSELDLPNPIWLDSNIRDFQLYAKTRFRQDNFVENISFDFLEFHVIEEDL